MRLFLTNVVAVGRLHGGSVDLVELAKRHRDIIYRPDKYTFAMYRGSHGTANIFRTGKVVISARSVDDVYNVARELERMGLRVDDIRMVNFVGNVDYCVSGRLTLDQFEALVQQFYGDYDTSLLPAVTVYVETEEGRCTAMVFNSGRTTIAGCKSIEHLEKVALKVREALEKIGARFRPECMAREGASP